jgi:hypothetical protein
MQPDHDANEQQGQQLEFDFEYKSDDSNDASQSPHDSGCPDSGRPVDQHVFTLMEVCGPCSSNSRKFSEGFNCSKGITSNQKQLAKLEAGYTARVEARLGDG